MWQHRESQRQFQAFTQDYLHYCCKRRSFSKQKFSVMYKSETWTKQNTGVNCLRVIDEFSKHKIQTFRNIFPLSENNLSIVSSTSTSVTICCLYCNLLFLALLNLFSRLLRITTNTVGPCCTIFNQMNKAPYFTK